jgi:hypothetical protein
LVLTILFLVVGVSIHLKDKRVIYHQVLGGIQLDLQELEDFSLEILNEQMKQTGEMSTLT